MTQGNLNADALLLLSCAITAAIWLAYRMGQKDANGKHYTAGFWDGASLGVRMLRVIDELPTVRVIKFARVMMLAAVTRTPLPDRATTESNVDRLIAELETKYARRPAGAKCK